MKRFKYNWNSQKYVVHIEAINSTKLPIRIAIDREYMDRTIVKENLNVGDINLRFIISKKNPKELSVTFSYEDSIVCAFYEIEDNAFYPITPIKIL